MISGYTQTLTTGETYLIFSTGPYTGDVDSIKIEPQIKDYGLKHND